MGVSKQVLTFLAKRFLRIFLKVTGHLLMILNGALYKVYLKLPSGSGKI